MKKLATYLFSLVLAWIPMACAQPGDAADTVYTNGRIYTVDEAQPWVEAVAIKDGTFQVVGSNAEVEAVTGGSTEVVDLGGDFAMPGLIDIHGFHGMSTENRVYSGVPVSRLPARPSAEP